jgi:hypothetical protein
VSIGAAVGVAAGAQAASSRANIRIAPTAFAKVGYFILLTPFESISIDSSTIRVREAHFNGDSYALMMDEIPSQSLESYESLNCD